MAQADKFVTAAQNDIVTILDKIEEAQAIAAARVQEIIKIGGMTVLDAYDWGSVEMTKAEFVDALQALQNDFPDLLGTAGEYLYPVKTKLG